MGNGEKLKRNYVTEFFKDSRKNKKDCVCFRELRNSSGK